ncbi:NDUFA3 isoform 12 [Pongo abelii]|uniref:NADH dehydrogenase [ubiquinone] 1 alpha subcomplex subunit 3 n=3 Tax=Pongo abelii TaxID=9601 RepID=A0A2J8XR98_PONAB|nr:NDUFA3 isoform 12 [Pongo abelii]
MAARVGAFLRNTWDKEPVLVVSFVIGGLAVILPPLSPYFKYSIMINKATPYNYPVEAGFHCVSQDGLDLLTL